jgi:arylsulfatase A-like enzyme
VTSDILPTILELTGIPLPAGNPPLDGVCLVPLIDGKQESRPRPVGFWDHPTPGLGTTNEKWMSELLEAQKKGEEGDRARLLLDAAEIKIQYPEDSFPGHSAWLAWPWKLHRIQPPKAQARLELYRLSDDPEEAKDLASAEPERLKSMSKELEEWLLSVVRSLNGADYR